MGKTMFRSALGICLWLALLVCQAAAEHQCQNYRYFVVVTPPTVGREINTYNKWLTDDTLTMDICLELHQTETWEPFPQGTVVGDYHLHVYDEPVEGMLFYINDGRAGTFLWLNPTREATEHFEVSVQDPHSTPDLASMFYMDLKVEFGGETLTSDLVQGCYTEGLEKNNTLHWTLNLAVTSCSAPLTLSNTMPQFGKEGTFGEGSAAGTGYWIRTFEPYAVNLSAGGFCDAILNGTAATNTEYPIVETVVYAEQEKEWNQYLLRVRLAHAKEYKRYDNGALVTVPVAGNENIRLIVELRDPEVIVCVPGADFFCSRRELEVLPGVVPSVTIVNLDGGHAMYFPNMLAFYGGFHHYGVNAKKPQGDENTGCIQLSQTLGGAEWLSAQKSLLMFDSPWLQLAPPDPAVTARVFPREKYSLTSTKTMLYLFGGVHEDKTTAQLFAFNLTSREWLQCREMEPCRSPGPGEVDTSPAVGVHSQWPYPRHSHMSATIKGRVVVLGGVGPFDERLGDVHTYDEDSSTWWRVSLKTGNSLTSAAFKLPLHPGMATVKDENGATVLVLVGGLNPSGECLSTILIIDPILGTLRQISSDIPPVQQLSATSMANAGVISSMLPEVVVLMGGQECSTGQPMADVFAIDTTGKVSSVGKLPDAFSTEACTTGMGSATGEATVVCPSSSYVYSLESQKFTQTANSTKSPTLLGGNPVTSMFATEVAMLDSSGAVWAYDPMQCSYNCSHNGLCVAGFCNCYDNFQGQFCETEVANQEVMIITFVVVSAVCLLGLALLLGLYLYSSRHKRDNRNAPRKSGAPLAVMFTDIEMSTSLWAEHPGAMADALQLHHNEIRSLIKKHMCYEVKTIGDAFMVVSDSPVRLLRLAMELQRRLYALDWKTFVIDELYARKTDWDASICHQDYKRCWNGLRVRIGLHYGNGQVEYDPVQKGYDYYGTTVNTASRIESVCHGGQVAISKAFWCAVGGQFPFVNAVDLGKQELRGLTDGIELMQVLPVEVQGRRFPPLRQHDMPETKFGDLGAAPQCVVNDIETADDQRRPSNVSRHSNSRTSMDVDTQLASHPLVRDGTISAEELKQQFQNCISCIQTLLDATPYDFKEATCKTLCKRFDVPYKGVADNQVMQTVGGLAMRVLPAVVQRRNDVPNLEPAVSRWLASPGRVSADREKNLVAVIPLAP